MNHIDHLRKFVAAGISCAPVKRLDKYPSMLKGWKKYQKEIPTTADINQWAAYYKDTEIYGCCIICGKVSGGIVMLEIDNKDGNATKLFDELTNIEEVAEILEGCPVEKSPSGGYHFYFRMHEPFGNLKLAMAGALTVIETRGEGGLVVCAPTINYELMQGDLTNIPHITAEQAETLFDYCRSFDKPEIKGQPEKSEREKKIEPSGDRPGDWFNDHHIDTAKGLLRQHGWTELNNGKHWRRPGKDGGVSATFGHIADDVFYCFSSNGGQIDSGRCYHPFDILTLFNFNGDYSAAARWVVENYGLKKDRHMPAGRKLRIEEVEGEEVPNPQKKTQTHSQTTSQHSHYSQPTTSSTFVNFETFEITTDDPAFWYFGGKEGTKFCIDYFQLRVFLSKHGFYRYELAPGQWILIRIVDNVAEEIEFEFMREFIGQFLIKRQDFNIYNYFFDSSKFSRGTLTNLPCVKIQWMRDTAEECFVFFTNGYTRTTKDGTKLHQYKEMQGVIWASQKLNRNYFDDHGIDFKTSDVYRFATLVSNNDTGRIAAYMGGIGYMLHRFKKETFCPIILWADENDTEEPRGGTGKGMSAKFIGKMRNLVIIDGKNFDPKKQFTLQRVDQKTDVVLLDDLAKNIDIEDLFSWVTDGLTVEKKHQGQIFIPFDESPKITATSNYIPRGSSTSYERRMFEIEIYPYFSPSYTPDNEFKKSFFRDWDNFDWLAFDVFMHECIFKYLKYGLVRPKYVTVSRNRIKNSTSDSFVVWAEKNLIPGKRYLKTAMLKDFKKTDEDDYWLQNKMSQHIFSKWVQSYCHYLGVEVNMRAGSGGAYMDIMAADGSCSSDDPFSDIATSDDVPF